MGVSATFSVNAGHRWLTIAVVGVALSGMIPNAFAAAWPPTVPDGLADLGVLRLQMGDPQGNRFWYDGGANFQFAQSIGVQSKCLLLLGGPYSMATLSAQGGNAEVGVGPGSLGVWDGPKGVACYRISAQDGESLEFGLDSNFPAVPVAGDTTHTVVPNAFYALDLDVEVKQDASIMLEILVDHVPTDYYYLHTGASITGAEDDVHTFACRSKSDSGPDAGSLDNCQWRISSVLGNGFRIVELAGQSSLEGGGDWGTDAYAHNTKVYLTNATLKALACGVSATVGDGETTPQCTVTRLDPSNVNGSCSTAVAVVMRSEGFTCSLTKQPGEQLVASMDITFPKEPRKELNDVPLTKIYFSGTTSPFYPPRCFGTLVEDASGTGKVISEVLYGIGTTYGFPEGTAFYDVVPGDNFVEWACVLNNGEDYSGSGLMQVHQKILFWGDIAFSRN